MNEEKILLLREQIQLRDREILDYQINIDNYQRGIAKVEQNHMDNDSMKQFLEVMKKNLQSAKNEQLKCQIIRDVMADQVAELEAATPTG